jgi:toxin ParE1/3/4
MHIEWVGTSFSDFQQIRLYLQTRNPFAAEKIYNAVSRSAEQLLSFPELGRPVEGSNIRLLQVPGLPYILPYRVKPDRIEILAVFDGRQERPAGWY